MASSTFVNFVMSMLRSHGVRPEQLVLEARETALLGRSVDVDRSVQALRRLGVRTAIDNFGTGANTLSVLTDIGADILKLDGVFGLSKGSAGAAAANYVELVSAERVDGRWVATVRDVDRGDGSG